MNKKYYNYGLRKESAKEYILNWLKSIKQRIGGKL